MTTPQWISHGNPLNLRGSYRLIDGGAPLDVYVTARSVQVACHSVASVTVPLGDDHGDNLRVVYLAQGQSSAGAAHALENLVAYIDRQIENIGGNGTGAHGDETKNYSVVNAQLVRQAVEVLAERIARAGRAGLDALFSEPKRRSW